MDKPTTLILKIISDSDVLDSLPKARALSDDQKAFIAFVARTAVQEYVQLERSTRVQSSRSDFMRNTDRIMRLPEVIEVTGLSRSSIYAHGHKGTFPKPLNLGSKSIGWKESQILDWLQNMKESF